VARLAANLRVVCANGIVARRHDGAAAVDGLILRLVDAPAAECDHLLVAGSGAFEELRVAGCAIAVFGTTAFDFAPRRDGLLEKLVPGGRHVFDRTTFDDGLTVFTHDVGKIWWRIGIEPVPDCFDLTVPNGQRAVAHLKVALRTLVTRVA